MRVSLIEVAGGLDGRGRRQRGSPRWVVIP